ncbi:MAG: hypothetical protein A2660_01225 [Candidatus Doudnabacteria bacterium RIFCSPHIGHO2_01_FULL_45_18]|uniref:Uncharacterized protein n=1 Tax=Candidatus Doudnabacteria bacterium RIFCSPHIGHO2_01_FULL_45_18 TaxID=1817823 RepID=A0A1F5NS52_9BACT|nr:MAG: hypothetical protein A2660_01225 [Candidatus Doudnabacteria bacterium RIFCSPHIGHO2_01_FULL_45_18]
MKLTPSFWTICKLWFFYLLPFWAAVPKIGELEEADCIFVQAFGRNNYTDAELGRVLWDLRTEVRLSDLDAFNLLAQRAFEPGASNRALAKYAMQRAYKYNIPIIAQWEVVFAIYQMDPNWYVSNRDLIDCLWPPKEGYFATWHVKVLSKERMRSRILCRPLEIAHPAMTVRAVPIIWSLGLNPVVEPISARESTRHELWVWDQSSIQPWTRNFQAWKVRELMGRVAHVVTHIWGVRHVIFAIKPHLSASAQQMIPGNWIRFFPPKTLTA